MSPTSPELDASLVGHVVRLTKRLLTPKEVADALGISLSLVYDLKESGDLEAHSIKASTPRRRLGKLIEEPLVDCCVMCNRSYPQRRRREVVATRHEERKRDSNLRITRRSVIAYVVSTATYDLDAEDLVLACVRILRDLPNDAVKGVAAEACRLATSRGLNQ